MQMRSLHTLLRFDCRDSAAIQLCIMADLDPLVRGSVVRCRAILEQVGVHLPSTVFRADGVSQNTREDSGPVGKNPTRISHPTLFFSPYSSPLPLFFFAHVLEGKQSRFVPKKEVEGKNMRCLLIAV